MGTFHTVRSPTKCTWLLSDCIQRSLHTCGSMTFMRTLACLIGDAPMRCKCGSAYVTPMRNVSLCNEALLIQTDTR